MQIFWNLRAVEHMGKLSLEIYTGPLWGPNFQLLWRAGSRRFLSDTLKISWRLDLIWLIYSGSKKCLFVCLFVRLFVDLFIFYFNHLGTPTGIYPENFVKIGLDLAEIYRILKNVYLFVCLFVCLLNCLFFILIILGHPQEYTLKISWG